MGKEVFFTILFILILIPLVSAPFGYNNPSLPNVPSPEVTIITFQNNTGAVNKSDYWDNLDFPNATQMENSDQQLNIKEAWFTTLWNAIFGAKTTDDLTQGTTNLYDNQSWNESFAGGLYWGINNGSYNATYASKADYQFLNNNFNGSGNFNTSGNISLGFGDLVSEGNIGGADAIRIKATVSDVDVVLGGGMSSYFNVYNTADDLAVFSVSDRGNTEIEGYVDMNSNQINELADPTLAQDAATKKYVDDKNVESFPTSLTNGSVIFSDGINLNQDNANFFWDNTNKRLGIGTASPLEKLDSRGNIRVGTSTSAAISMTGGQTGIIFTGAGATTRHTVMYENSGAGGGFYIRQDFGDLVFLSQNGEDILLQTGAGHSGKVGIMATPTETLQIGGNLFLQDDLDKILFGTAKDVSISYNGSQTQFTNEVGSGDWIFGSGKVGIGTNNPTSVLETSATGSAAIVRFLNPTTSQSTGFHMGETVTAGTTFQQFGSTHALADFLWITTPGDVSWWGLDNFGIGTLTPNQKLHVVGNANVTGNITSENVFIPQYIFAHTNRTHVLASANVWANITFDQEATAIKKGIGHTFNDNTNYTFTINTAGIYEIDFDFDAIDVSGSSTDIDIAGRVIYVNGTEITGSVFETDITKKDIEVELSHHMMARFESGDIIVFQFIATDVDVQLSTHGNFGDHPDSATIKILKVANL